MPISTTNKPPSLTPKLRVEFSGLLLIQTVSGGCRIAVHPTAPGHNLSITLVTSDPATGVHVEPLQIGPLTQSDFVIDLDRPSDQALEAFQSSPGPHVLDISNAISRKIFYSYPAQINPLCFPGIWLKAGTLYSHELSTHDAVFACTGTTQPPAPRKIACVIGAAINPTTSGTMATLQWTLPGDTTPTTKTLPFTGTAGNISYVLSISNEPSPHVSDPHDEFAYFSQMLLDGNGKAVTSSCSVSFPYLSPQLSTDSFTLSPNVPCMPVVDDGPPT